MKNRILGKLVTGALLLCLGVSLAGCGGKTTAGSADGDGANAKQNLSEDAGASDDQPDYSDGPEESEDEPDISANGMPVIEEQVFYDKDDIQFIAKAIVCDGYGNYGLEYFVENNSEDKIITYEFGIMSEREGYLRSAGMYVNNLFLQSFTHADVTYGEKRDEVVYFEGLKNAGFESVGKIEFTMRVSVTPIGYTGGVESYVPVVIETSDVAAMDTTVNLPELYNHDGVIISGEYGMENDYGDKELVLYVTNNTDRNLGIAFKSLIVNGEETLSGYRSEGNGDIIRNEFAEYTQPGRITRYTGTIYNYVTEEHMKEVNSIEAVFNIVDAEGYVYSGDVIATSDLVTIPVK